MIQKIIGTIVGYAILFGAYLLLLAGMSLLIESMIWFGNYLYWGSPKIAFSEQLFWTIYQWSFFICIVILIFCVIYKFINNYLEVVGDLLELKPPQQITKEMLQMIAALATVAGAAVAVLYFIMGLTSR